MGLEGAELIFIGDSTRWCWCKQVVPKVAQDEKKQGNGAGDTEEVKVMVVTGTGIYTRIWGGENWKIEANSLPFPIILSSGARQ